MINQGFDIEEVYLNAPLPDSISILVISELRSPLLAKEMDHLQEFINRGGNLFVLGGPGRQELMNSLEFASCRVNWCNPPRYFKRI